MDFYPWSVCFLLFGFIVTLEIVLKLLDTAIFAHFKFYCGYGKLVIVLNLLVFKVPQHKYFCKYRIDAVRASNRMLSCQKNGYVQSCNKPRHTHLSMCCNGRFKSIIEFYFDFFDCFECSIKRMPVKLMTKQVFIFLEFFKNVNPT